MMIYEYLIMGHLLDNCKIVARGLGGTYVLSGLIWQWGRGSQATPGSSDADPVLRPMVYSHIGGNHSFYWICLGFFKICLGILGDFGTNQSLDLSSC